MACHCRFGTQAQRLVPVAQFFLWLRRSGRITTNPAENLTMPRPDRRLPEATLSAAEMASLLRTPDVSQPLGLRDRAVLEVFYSCGLRRAELIDLTVRDVDYDRGTVFVRCGKGAKDRYVPIGERALFWLRLYEDLVRPAFVTEEFPERLFLSSVGTPLCPDWLSRKIRRFLAVAGIPKRGSCHLIRHTVATLSIDRLRVVHSATHPAAGLDVAMATELRSVLPSGGQTLLRRLSSSGADRP